MSDPVSNESGAVWPVVSVVVPTFRDWQRLEKCLDTLADQTYPNECYEIIIVNNDPNDHAAMIDLPPNAQLITEQRRGSYAARNAALLLAKGEIVAFTDSDCIPDKNWVENAVLFFSEHPEVMRLGGLIELFYQGDQLNAAEIYEKAFSFRQREYVEHHGAAATANMFARRNVFTQIGLFDGNVYSGGDMEWGVRAEKAGYPIAYCPAAVVLHPSRSTLREIMDKFRRVGGGAQLSRLSLRNLFAIATGVLPPVVDGLRIMRRSDLSLREKFISLSVRYLARLVFNFERLRIMFLGKKPENI